MSNGLSLMPNYTLQIQTIIIYTRAQEGFSIEGGEGGGGEYETTHLAIILWCLGSHLN